MKTSLFLGTALTALLVTGMASAAKKTYAVNAEAPAGVETANSVDGPVRLTIDDEAGTVCGRAKFSTSTFTPKGFDLRTGDGTALGDLIVALGAGTRDATDTKTITFSLKDGDKTKLAAANTDPAALNITSDSHADGELRGALEEDNEGDEVLCDTAIGGADAGADSGAGSGSGSGTGGGDGGGGGTGTGTSSGAAGTPASTDDGGCNTTGGSSGSGFAVAAGLGVALLAASRRRKKA